MNTLAALAAAAAAARAASEIAQLCCAPPFPCCLWEMEVFEDVDKAGVVAALLSAASLSILPVFERRGIQTCRAETLEQQPLFVLIASDSEGNSPPFTSSLHVSHY